MRARGAAKSGGLKTGREVKRLSLTLSEALEIRTRPVWFWLQVLPGTDADMTVGTLVSAAEGAAVEEAEAEKETALPPGEGASLEEPKLDTEATEAVDSDRCQPEAAEAAAPPVSVLVKWRFEGEAPAGMLCWLTAIVLGRGIRL